MSSPTQLKLPNSLPYPVKLLHLAAPPNTEVQRGTRLLDYSFAYLSSDGQTESRFGTWDSPLDGTVTRWLFNKGEVIHRSRAEDSPAVSILEPCKHGIVFGGLCGICGKDLTRCAPILPPRPHARSRAAPPAAPSSYMRLCLLSPAGLITLAARWTTAAPQSP